MNRWLIALIALLAVLALGLLIASQFEFTPTTVTKPAQPEIARDDWTAFARGLKNPVDRYGAVAEIDLENAGLVVLHWWQLQSEDPVRWLEWVAGGGRLLVVFDGEDEVSEQWLDIEPFRGLVPQYRQDEGTESRAKLPGSTVEVDPYVYFNKLEAPEDIVYQDGDRAVLVLRNEGEGWILATADPVYLYNDGLADAANREFASSLVRGLAGDAWLYLPKVEFPLHDSGLGSVPLGLSLLLLAALIYWRAGARLGPPLPTAPADRLSLGERFLAEGRFLWRHRAAPGQQGRQISPYIQTVKAAQAPSHQKKETP